MGLLQKVRDVKAVWKEFSAIEPSTHASSIAYYTFLSLVPLLALCISLITLAGVGTQEVYDFLMALVPEALSDLAATLVADAFDRSGLALSLSSLSLVWSASKGAKALRAGLNAAYGEQEDRGAIAVAAISVAAVVTMGLLIAAALWLMFGNSLLHALSQGIAGVEPSADLLNLIVLLATLVAGMLFITLCYTRLPAGSRHFAAQMPGAGVTLVACGILSFGFRLYVDNLGNSARLYGSMATIALLLLWLYLVFYIVIAGAFVNRFLQERENSQETEG